jgi:hypothetical protein
VLPAPGASWLCQNGRTGFWRLLLVYICVCAAFILQACGGPTRDNPFDPHLDDGRGADLQLVVEIPLDEGQLPAVIGGVESITYEISAEDLKQSITGTMNLVGTRAQALALDVPEGNQRRVRVDAYGPDRIRLLRAGDTLDIVAGGTQQLQLDFERLRGTLEVVGQLPPELVEVDIIVSADGDTLRQKFAIDGAFQGRLEGIPTGPAAQVGLEGFDAEGQLLVNRELMVDIRAGLPAQIVLELRLGALEVEARFPELAPLVAIDRFSDEAGTFFLRSQQVGLPGPNEPIDFDVDFLFKGIGPNGERIEFYLFDVRDDTPPPVYILVDRRGDPIPGQLPIFDLLPGEEGHSDIWRVHQVRLTALEYIANSINTAQQIFDAELEVEITTQGYHAVIVPDGSSASRRWDLDIPRGLQNGWYRGQIVKYLLFENPQSPFPLILGAERVETPQMFGFLANDRDVLDGFAVDPQSGETHNVVAVLPGEESYAPLWVLQVFKLTAFDRFNSLADAIREDEENSIDLGILHINAPIVGLEEQNSGNEP